MLGPYLLIAQFAPRLPKTIVVLLGSHIEITPDWYVTTRSDLWTGTVQDLRMMSA